jgi:hypothetical protein
MCAEGVYALVSASMVDEMSAAPVEPIKRQQRPGPVVQKVRSPADRLVRRALFMPDRPSTARDGQVYGVFSTSILISATRCVLSYVIFPIFAPMISAATGVGPAIGLVVGVVALVFDVVSIRRFWIAEHQWRWPMTAVYAVVIGLVSVLLVRDISHLLN